MSTTPISTHGTVTPIRPGIPSRVPLQADTTVTVTSPRDEPDRWLATTVTEQATLAHVRGWTHFGPQCAICFPGAS